MGWLRSLLSRASVRAAERLTISHLLSVHLTSAGKSEHSGEEHRPWKVAGKLHFLEKKKESWWSLFSVALAECTYKVIYATGSCLEFAFMQFKDFLTKFGVHTIENNPSSQIPSLLHSATKTNSVQHNPEMKEKFWNWICDGRAGNSSSWQNWPLKMKKAIPAFRIAHLNHLRLK